MLVGYNVDGDTKHHVVEVGTDDPNDAIFAVKDMLKEEGIKASRVLAVVDGGKKTASVPVLELPPVLA